MRVFILAALLLLLAVSATATLPSAGSLHTHLSHFENKHCQVVSTSNLR